MLTLTSGDKIIFTGDSITDADRDRPIGQGRGEQLGTGFVHMIHSLLSADYPQVYFEVVNTGISGNTSRDLIGRWQEDVLDLHGDCVVICIGVNDVWKQFSCPAMVAYHVPIEEYEKNLHAMIERSQNAGLNKIILMTPFFMETNKADTLLQKMDEYGAVCKAVALSHNLPCVDLQEAFDRYLAYRHPCFIQSDRIHPDWTGSLLIARAFLKKMGYDHPTI